MAAHDGKKVRFAVDTGGTFTDLVIEEGDRTLHLYKAPTTPDNPIDGVRNVLQIAADDRGIQPADLLQQGRMFIHGTTRAINAILTKSTAKTAFLTTKGHPDILVFREGGRTDPFDYRLPYPEPYVSRSLTFEVPERIGSRGEIVRPLDEAAVIEIASQLKDRMIQAVGVCFLWSTVNALHEARVGELLEEHLPDVPVTLSHKLNPALREYRRASSVVIDASLKPLMTSYLQGLERWLREAGFGGRLLIVTSNGGVRDASLVADEPIHTINSGPAMAPVSGRYFAYIDGGKDTAVVADTGGTSYDVSLVRHGRISSTRETWLGPAYFGHMTGFPSVNIKSIGAGGGSLAWVDGGGLLHVGPQSAGAVPGPVAYGRGGTVPTVTDAGLVLGYIDPNYFLGGAMPLDVGAAARAIDEQIAALLGLDLYAAAAAIFTVATQQMVDAIHEITVNQGVDPRSAVLVAGGGAAGLNAVAIARQLGCDRVVVPEVGATLSAAGALMSDLVVDYGATIVADTSNFDHEAANRVLQELEGRCNEFIADAGATRDESTVEFSLEARYPYQVWELEVPLAGERFRSHDDVERFRLDFHRLHEEIFAIQQEDARVEILGARAHVRCRLDVSDRVRIAKRPAQPPLRRSRVLYFADAGHTDAAVRHLGEMELGEVVEGPAIIDSPFSTVVVDPAASAHRTASGSLLLNVMEARTGTWQSSGAPRAEHSSKIDP